MPRVKGKEQLCLSEKKYFTSVQGIGGSTLFDRYQDIEGVIEKNVDEKFRHFLAQPDLPSGAYNAGFENISILDIAKAVQQKIPTEIVVTESNDPRSYRQNSDKLLATGFKQQYSVQTAIEEIIVSYDKGQLVESDQCYTVKWMKQLAL